MLPELTPWYTDFMTRRKVRDRGVEICDARRKDQTDRGLCIDCGVYPAAGGHTHTAAAARAAGLCHGCYKKRSSMKRGA